MGLTGVKFHPTYRGYFTRFITIVGAHLNLLAVFNILLYHCWFQLKGWYYIYV